MSQIIKYLIVALLSIALTIFYLDQYAPIIVEVPEKVSQRMEIEFSKEIERRPIQKIEKKAKNVIILIGAGMGINWRNEMHGLAVWAPAGWGRDGPT